MRTASALALLGLILAVAMPESTKARCFPSSRGARYDCPKESDVKDDGDKKLDPDTGLLVISSESDQNWNSNPNYHNLLRFPGELFLTIFFLISPPLRLIRPPLWLISRQGCLIRIC